MQYVRRLVQRVSDYIWSFFCSTNEKGSDVVPLDPKERLVYEDYMASKDLQELNEIISFVRKKENDIKSKCKLR